jgi:hypothetical protein
VKDMDNKEELLNVNDVADIENEGVNAKKKSRSSLRRALRDPSLFKGTRINEKTLK